MLRHLIAAVTAITLMLLVTFGGGAQNAAANDAAAPAQNARLPQKPLRLDYAVYAGGLHAMDLHVRLARAGKRYQIQGQVRTAGMVARLFPFVLEAVTQGRQEARHLRPDRYQTANRWRNGDIRSVRLDYRPPEPPRVEATPPLAKDDRAVVPDSERRDTRDPLTALTALLVPSSGVCSGNARIFDGRRLFRVSAKSGDMAEVDGGRYGVYSGLARRCQLGVATVDGFWRKFDEADRYPQAVDIWIAPPRPETPPVPVRLELATEYFTVVAHLTAIKRGAAAKLPTSSLSLLENSTALSTAEAGEGVR